MVARTTDRLRSDRATARSWVHPGPVRCGNRSARCDLNVHGTAPIKVASIFSCSRANCKMQMHIAFCMATHNYSGEEERLRAKVGQGRRSRRRRGLWLKICIDSLQNDAECKVQGVGFPRMALSRPPSWRGGDVTGGRGAEPDGTAAAFGAGAAPAARSCGTDDRGGCSQRLEVSPAKISRIETGRVSVRPRDVSDLLDQYEIYGMHRDNLLTLTREARQQGWWHSYSDVLSEGTDIWVGLETEAEAIRLYEVQLIPGLLQTSEYARAVLRAHYRSEPPEQIEQRVKLRMARQQLVIEQNNTPIWAVLDEAVLRRHMGPPEIMQSQYRRLLEIL